MSPHRCIHHRLIGLALLVLTAHFFLAAQVGAIPAFSRKYRTSCNTCHVAYPKLNDFGHSFRRNGFQFSQDDEYFVKDKPVTMAADAWRELWPTALWPSDLPNLPPIAFRVIVGMDQAESATTKMDMDAPTDVNILAAGTFSEDISFFFHQGGGSRYYVQFSNLLEEALSETLLPRYALNAKLGLFEPELLPYSNVRRLSATQYLSHTATYLRNDGYAGNSFQLDRQIGLELHGIIKQNFRYVLGGVSGNGDSNDNNNAKDIYGRLSWKWGGLNFSGEEELTEAELDAQETANDPLFRDNAHEDNSITWGIFAYQGRYTGYNSDPGVTASYDIDFQRIGLDVRLNYKDFDLTGGIQYGKDENGLDTNYDIASTLYFANLDYVAFPWLVTSCRYEKIFYGDPATSDLDDQETDRFTLTATALIRANLKLSFEGQLNQDLGYSGTEDDLLLLRLDWSF